MQVLEGVFAGLQGAHIFQIPAGTEGTAGAPKHGDTSLGVIVEFQEGLDQGIAGFRVDGVPGLGPIVDDGGDGAVLLHSYCHWISSRFSAKDATLPLRKRQLGS